MSEIKLISPMLDTIDIGEPISQHDGVRCCPAMEKGTDDKYILKVISVPASQVQLDALLITGAYKNSEEAGEYFREISEQILQEVQILQNLSGLEGFLPYNTCQTVPMENETGYDIYLLGPYRRTLAKHFKRSPMTHLGAVNLGLDLCASLAVCRHSGYLYVDLKPGNICITDDNSYRIFDLGFVKLDALKYASLPDRYISQYTAPEIKDAFSSLNATIDIYAVGLILYQAYNDGVLPFKGDRPTEEVFPAPAYADYEMAEIILKACAPNPDDRWQTPIEMGQAIVSYMQRNGANDTPIAPVSPAEINTTEDVSESADLIEDLQAEQNEILEAAIENAESGEENSDNTVITDDALSENTPEKVSDEISADETADSGDSLYMEDEFGNLVFLEDATYDETIPDEDVADVPYDEVSEEASEMLYYADELLAHPTPEPVVQPEPIPVSLPEPDLEANEPENQEDCPTEVFTESVADVEQEDVFSEDESTDIEDYDEEETDPAPKNSKPLILGLICIFLALALAAFGLYFYRHYYLQPVTVTIDGTDNSLIVYVNSEVDDDKLTVLCTDTYGNSLPMPVVDGKAVFENLAPGSGYTVSVYVSGFHRLTGDTATAYSTPVQTNVIQFTALTGAEDGSVILSFTVEGPDAQQWSVEYSAEGEEPKTEVFTGHMVTLSGLTIGKEYTFNLASEKSVYIGNQQIKWTAGKLVCAEDLKVDSFIDNKLTASWKAPENTTVESWTVRCYNGSDFDETITTSETSAIFENVDQTQGYTVEVTAANMSVGERTNISENSVTVLDCAVDANDPKQLILTWNTNYPLAVGNWILLYSIDGSESQEITCSNDNKAIISPVVPGATYQFTLMTSTGSNVFSNTYTHTTAAAPKFADYGVTADNMTFRMCKTPAVENWDRSDLASSDYKTSFTIGEKASFLVRLNTKYNTSSDLIQTTFYVRDNSGKIVSIATTEKSWTDMWYKYYCELDIPSLPEVVGAYTMGILFNGCYAGEQTFSITAS